MVCKVLSNPNHSMILCVNFGVLNNLRLLILCVSYILTKIFSLMISVFILCNSVSLSSVVTFFSVPFFVLEEA